MRYSPRIRETGSIFPSLVHRWGQPKGVKSVQRATITIANTATSSTATINAIDVNNAALRWCGAANADSGAQPDRDWASLTLTNSTTVTATRVGNVNASTFSFEIVEYWPGIIKSLQRGTIAIGNGSTSNTATITSVDPTRAECSFLGIQSTSTDQTGQTAVSFARLTLTNATTVTATRDTSHTSTDTVAYQVIEYF